jgi:hypothetical protein
VKIRSTAIMHGVPCITTISGAQASVNGIEVLLKKDLDVKPLQAYHEKKESMRHAGGVNKSKRKKAKSKK